LYSLGAVLFTLLTGRPVFRGKSVGEVLYKQQFETPESVHRYNSDVPQELGQIILQLLEKDPARRIPNAVILGRYLEAMQHAMQMPGATLEADASYFQHEDLSPEEMPALDNHILADNSLDSPADLPFTQPFLSPGHPSDASSASQVHLDDNSLSSVTPPANSLESQEKSSDRFVPVSREELGKDESAEPGRPLISLHTWLLAAALLFVGFAIWYTLQPPSPDALYDKIAAQVKDDSIASMLSAKDTIQSFLERYPDDPRAAKVRKYQHEIVLYQLDRKFALQIEGIGIQQRLLPVERVYVEALRLEKIDPARCVDKLRALLDLYQDPTETAGPVGDCLINARRRLQKLQHQIAEHADEQIDMLRQRLVAADTLAKTDPRRAENMYRAAIELYGDKPWAADLVRKAQTGLNNFQKQHLKDKPEP
ncbi:MAG: hypothetical protein ACWGMZ_08105, partial [Thermoguttaceae bacterium]